VIFSFRGLGRGITMATQYLVEICFHGRGGQGAVTAANLLVAAALIDGNKGVQAFPFFGAERRGAPVRAFARISHDEIHLRSEIYNPDIVIVLDESIRYHRCFKGFEEKWKNFN
jgi:2-oxoacid:acceptor oxidoreductase gamma subunit (pyruvate/2-ketoisovalerate family)